MRSIWFAAAMFATGLAIVVLRPLFLTDGAGTSVYSGSIGVFTWFGWLLLVVGGIMTVLSMFRSRRNDRS